MNTFKVLLCMGLTLFLVTASGQETQPDMARIKGIVTDSLLQRVVPAATVSVYLTEDSSLITYTITDQSGIFWLSNIPKNTELTTVIAYIGYESVIKKFKITKDGDFDMGRINISMSETLLEEISIKPPVWMKGDTLEFNADAFKLDPNAVAEDLLKRLPGVIVWGDGLITVNGREIHALLVDGKPFFGGDRKIATQNIAKDAIDKVQVYQREQTTSIMDSITEINIVTKNPGALGYFGKLAMGMGISNRKDLVSNLNLFKGGTQASLILGHNNVNKQSDDIFVLIRNSTYKGVGIENEYETDFNKSGNINSSIAGIFLQHDFIPGVDLLKKNTLKLDYLYNRSRVDLDHDNQTITTIGDHTAQFRKGAINSFNKNIQNIFNANYELTRKNYTFNLLVRASSKNLGSDISTTDKVADQNGNVTSGRTQQQFQNEENNELDINLSIKHSKNLDHHVRLPGNWSLLYGIRLHDRQDQSDHSSRFVSYIDPSVNQNFDRNNQHSSNYTGHHFKGRIGNLWNTLVGVNFDNTLELVNDLDLDIRNINNSVYNMNGLSLSNEMDPVLSYKRQEQVLDWRPGAFWQKRFSNILSNRYEKTGEISVELRHQYFVLTSASNRGFQNFERNYNRFLPKLSYSFMHQAPQRFSNRFNVSLASTYTFPSVEDLFPVVDTTDIYHIRYGNENLKPSNNREINSTFSHTNRKKNAFMYELILNLGDIRDAFSHFTRIDASGRTSFSLHNLDNSQYISLGANAAKALQFEHHKIQIKARGNFRFSNRPSYLVIQQDENISELLNNTRSVFGDASFNILFSHRELLDLNLITYMELYRNIQKAYDYSISNKRYRVESHALIKPTRKSTIGINTSYHRNNLYRFSDDYIICNLRISHRFFKNENLEITTAIYDIFDQNRKINMQTHDNVSIQNRYNTIGRHFIMTLSYYPRYFRK